VVTHQLQVERRTGKVRRPETDVLPLCHATNAVTVACRFLPVSPLISAVKFLFSCYAVAEFQTRVPPAPLLSLVLYTNRPFGHQRRCTKRLAIRGRSVRRRSNSWTDGEGRGGTARSPGRTGTHGRAGARPGREILIGRRPSLSIDWRPTDWAH